MVEIRDATTQDLPALLRIRNTPHLFEDYFEEAKAGVHQFLVCVRDSAVIGFARLKRPVSCERDPIKRPLISDVCIAPQFRSKGIGSAFIRHIEDHARALGYAQLYIGVDPVESPRAFALYRRLGYIPLQEDPYRAERTFHPPGGSPPAKKAYWRVGLVKRLDENQPLANQRMQRTSSR